MNHSTLAIVNGAQRSQDAGAWDAPFDSAYDVVRDYRLRPMGVTERQVAVIWIKQADAEPSVALP